jgi:DNA repair ATPase RecN
MDPAEYEEMLRRLMAMLVGQHEINQRLDATIERLDGAITELRVFTREQVAINQRLEVTQARIETILTRILRPDDNGRDA